MAGARGGGRRIGAERRGLTGQGHRPWWAMALSLGVTSRSALSSGEAEVISGNGGSSGLLTHPALMQPDAQTSATASELGRRRRLHIVEVVPPYFDIPPAAYGGVESVVADLADELVARGHQVTILGAGKQRTKARYVQLWDRTLPERLGEAYPEIMNILLTRRAIQRLARWDGIDVIHEHTVGGPVNATIYAGLGLPTVVTAHGPVDREFGVLYRELGQDIDLVAISDRQRTLAPDLNWVGRVHNAVRVESFPFRRQKQAYALFLGRFSPDKGAHLALEAAHEAGLPLVLAGKCEEAVEKKYLDGEVMPRLRPEDTFLGVADAHAKRKLLANAACLLFPVQWEEPFGMVMIEAMACGTPVVAMRAGAVPEVVRHEVTGIICDEAGQLSGAIRDSGDIDPYACRAHVAQSFSAQMLAAGYEGVFRSLLTARQHDLVSHTMTVAGVTRRRSHQRPLVKDRPWKPGMRAGGRM